MKRIYIFAIFIMLLVISACGKPEFYGEYSTDGEPRYDIKIMDNNTATINIEDMFTVEYERDGDSLEVVQDDVYYYYKDWVTEVYFELTDGDTLLYKVSDGEVEQEIGEFTRIKGSDGDSGEPSMLWMTVKNLFFGLLIFIGISFIVRLIFQFTNRV
ncbi:hypothetical protein ACFOGI_15225 [Virgibacillus xinjiangensis]|uniref:DUF4178 domain-containing protein n=1 Tax=Virgibacillus xinjiangensis TaxID=393090 RepID=A0ABV7CZ57_9BACI